MQVRALLFRTSKFLMLLILQVAFHFHGQCLQSAVECNLINNQNLGT